MKKRLYKEYVALFPTWMVALSLAIVPALIANDAVPLWLGLFGIGTTLLAVEWFGKEFADGTMSLLLAQPITRCRRRFPCLAFGDGTNPPPSAHALSGHLGGRYFKRKFISNK